MFTSRFTGAQLPAGVLLPRRWVDDLEFRHELEELADGLVADRERIRRPAALPVQYIGRGH